MFLPLSHPGWFVLRLQVSTKSCRGGQGLTRTELRGETRGRDGSYYGLTGRGSGNTGSGSGNRVLDKGLVAPTKYRGVEEGGVERYRGVPHGEKVGFTA